MITRFGHSRERLPGKTLFTLEARDTTRPRFLSSSSSATNYKTHLTATRITRAAHTTPGQDRKGGALHRIKRQSIASVLTNQTEPATLSLRKGKKKDSNTLHQANQPLTYCLPLSPKCQPPAPSPSRRRRTDAPNVLSKSARHKPLTPTIQSPSKPQMYPHSSQTQTRKSNCPLPSTPSSPLPDNSPLRPR